MTAPNNNSADLVDRIGALKALISPQLAKLKELEAELKAFGEGRYLGDYYVATVSIAERDTLDMVPVRKKLTPQFIAAHTKTTEVTTLKVTAHKVAVAA